MPESSAFFPFLMASEAPVLRIPTSPAGGGALAGFGGQGYERQAVTEAPARANDGGAASGQHTSGDGAPGTPVVPLKPAEQLEKFLKDDFIEKYL